MPPSSDQDNNPAASFDVKSNKATQKGQAAQISTKSGKKNGQAKDTGGGGVMAAVKKDGKMASKQSSQSTPSKSPDTKPVGEPAVDNGSAIVSPLLDALSATSSGRSLAQNMTDWTKNVPAGTSYSTSPNNLINLGESPPTLPSSYEERLGNFGRSPREQRGIQNGQFQSVSPPTPNRRRPLSYNQIDGNFPGFDDHRSQPSSYANRRSSMYSQQSRYTNPPLPHQAQAHFYGVPDANLLFPHPASALAPGEQGYYCGFDRQPVLSPRNNSRLQETVVVSGFEGGIVTHKVTKQGLNKVSTVDTGARSVYHAKILPWTNEASNNEIYPLIAVVVHGPVLPTNDESSGDETPLSDHLPLTPTESLRGSPHPAVRQPQDMDVIEYYQTTVEVYSMSKNCHISTLIRLPKIRLPVSMSSPLFRPPPPSGALTIQADRGNVVVASGVSGEIWVYRQGNPSSPKEFNCIGKVWTTIQHGVSTEGSDQGLIDGDWNGSDPNDTSYQYKAPIFSLNGRWLAHCPPAPSSQISLRAIVPNASRSSRMPGLSAQAPPQLPSVNCMVETPGSDSMMKQLVQLGTQKLIEGATFLGGQGVQAWNNYWYKPPQSQGTAGNQTYQAPQHGGQRFPPTHGASQQVPMAAKDPGLVSIIDLDCPTQQRITEYLPSHPLTTFRLPLGCSFLSFAPSGLALFTASSKGDVQVVWDLMRMQYARSTFLKGDTQRTGTQGPHVRQIAQFSRMTIARIVDVVWTSPHGERAVMVTEPGTVHVLDLPASAFVWPPPRRRVPIPNAEISNSEIAGTVSTATAVASSAVTSLWTAARPLVSRRRRSSTGLSARTMTAQAGHGTQVLAAGISRSVGAATGRVNEMRKSGNTKLHLPKSTTIPSSSCVALITGKKNDSIVVLGGGTVGYYTIKNRRGDRPAARQSASRGAKYVEFRLPRLPHQKFAPQEVYQSDDLELTERDLDAQFKTRASPAFAKPSHGTESSIPQAEIESNAPYQPFHTDRRVGLHVYFNEPTTNSSPSVSVLLTSSSTGPEKRVSPSTDSNAWAFGCQITTRKIDVGSVQRPDDDLASSVDHRALPLSAIERITRITDSNENMEQIVVTTRRRKGFPRTTTEGSGEADEEGFFEDDCEVLDFASQRV